MVHILSGWSNGGGSTEAFINLTNSLNKHGIKTTFYGPHPFPKNKCNFEIHDNYRMRLNPKDSIIVHFLHLPRRLNCKKFILSCHEQNIFELKNINCKIFDKIHFVSDHQRKYHSVKHPYFILPNIIDPRLKPSDSKPDEPTAGIIGSIDRNKNIHVSIQRALDDGFKKIRIFGVITDKGYYENSVKSLIDKHGDLIEYNGYIEDKQLVYDSVTDVYHSSTLETWGYIKGECKRTNTVFHGNDSTDGYWEMDEKEIVNKWVEELDA